MLKRISKKQKQKIEVMKATVRENKQERKAYNLKAPAYAPPRIVNFRNVREYSVRNGATHESVNIKRQIELNEEMQERENIALLEKEKLKLRTAPLYSKGPYQYIPDDPDIIRDLGKKI